MVLGGKLLKAEQIFYFDSRTYDSIGMEVSVLFPVNVGFSHGYVMSRWLNNVYMDGEVRDMDARVREKGLELRGRMVAGLR